MLCLAEDEDRHGCRFTGSWRSCCCGEWAPAEHTGAGLAAFERPSAGACVHGLLLGERPPVRCVLTALATDMMTYKLWSVFRIQRELMPQTSFQSHGWPDPFFSAERCVGCLAGRTQ